MRSCCGPIWVGTRVDKLKLQLCLGLHDVLHARRIVNARKLDQNFVLSGPPVLLKHDLSDSKLVNAIADGIDGLIDRLRAVTLLLGRFEPDRVRVRHLSGSDPPRLSPSVEDAGSLSRCSRSRTAVTGPGSRTPSGPSSRGNTRNFRREAWCPWRESNPQPFP